MTTPLAPSRRRRHARLIAMATTLVAECAQAASAVYEPVAAANTMDEAVPLNLLPFLALKSSAGTRLEQARADDRKRCPADTQAETRAAQRTAARRRVIAEAEEVLQSADDQSERSLIHAMDPAQSATIGCGPDLLRVLEDAPDTIPDYLTELAADGEYTAEEALDDAVETALIAAQLLIHDAPTSAEEDPSLAAETALEAARHLALAVRVASMDSPDEGRQQ